MAANSGASEGPATDRRNEPVRDPSPNVLDLVTASVERLNDLAALRAYYIEREMELRAACQRELNEKEAARIDANRAQDQDSARRSTETALTAVQALAVQVPVTADTVRTAQAALLSPVLERLTNIERVQYEQAGSKQQVGESRLSQSAIVGYIIGAFGALVGLSGLVIALTR